MDYRNMTAPCGLDCFNCPVYLAGADDRLREKIAAGLGIPPEKVSCRGCRNHDGAIPFLGMTEPCSVYRCITTKGLSFCSECEDFPCDRLHPYADSAALVPHNTKVFNLCLIRRMGLDAWARDKAKSVKETYFKGKFRL
ncbi:MAG TPA: DUF3795 domain-containing protein [Deltaproteobacteria bacterium]|nr:DUF3795 domain-containing protein [Deltaproteobacteria bacterium]